MSAWAVLLGSLGLNYANHRSGLPTICSTGRRYVPRPLMTAALDLGYLLLRDHVLNGYPERTSHAR